MKILIGDNGNIDFDEPVKLSKRDFDKFISLLKELYEPSVIEIVHINEHREDRLGDKLFSKEWSQEELIALLQIKSTEKLHALLGRTWMSVDIMRGWFLPKFVAWAEETGYDIIHDNLEKMVTEFMKTQEDLKETRREAQKERTRIKHELEEILFESKEPCMVFNLKIYGGECANGFHAGCRTCPRSKGYIKNIDTAKKFTKVYLEEFSDDVEARRSMDI